MNRDRKRERRRNVFSILGLLALLMYILQLWPVLVLILSGMVVYVFWLLFHLEKEPVQPAPPMPAGWSPPPPCPRRQSSAPAPPLRPAKRPARPALPAQTAAAA